MSAYLNGKEVALNYITFDTKETDGRYSNILKGTATGSHIYIDDISPNGSDMTIQLLDVNKLLPYDEYNGTILGIEAPINEDNSLTVVGKSTEVFTEKTVFKITLPAGLHKIEYVSTSENLDDNVIAVMDAPVESESGSFITEVEANAQLLFRLTEEKDIYLVLCVYSQEGASISLTSKVTVSTAVKVNNVNYFADENGKILISNIPITAEIDSPVEVEVEYNKDINKAFEEQQTQIETQIEEQQTQIEEQQTQIDEQQTRIDEAKENLIELKEDIILKNEETDKIIADNSNITNQIKSVCRTTVEGEGVEIYDVDTYYDIVIFPQSLSDVKYLYISDLDSNNYISLSPPYKEEISVKIPYKNAKILVGSEVNSKPVLSYAKVTYIKSVEKCLDNIETALDTIISQQESIIEIQNSLIGGGNE